MTIEASIIYKQTPAITAITTRINLKQRADLYPALQQLYQRIPRKAITGSPFGIIHFITTIQEGIDLEIGFPIHQALGIPGLNLRKLPALETLALVHTGALERISESYQALFRYASEHALISDEVAREVYLDFPAAGGQAQVELQFVIHNWQALLEKNLERVLRAEAQSQLMQASTPVGLTASVNQRFGWVKGVIDQLDHMADASQRYEILSRCAHVFPEEHIHRLREAYTNARALSVDPLQAVDATLEFMAQDPVWRKPPIRQGHVIYATKNPRDPKSYAQAKNEADRRRAYCFCPLIRNNLDQGMSPSFCNCSAGWERQQWEGTLGVPLRVEVIESLLMGNEQCSFAIYLPEEL